MQQLPSCDAASNQVSFFFFLKKGSREREKGKEEREKGGEKEEGKRKERGGKEKEGRGEEREGGRRERERGGMERERGGKRGETLPFVSLPSPPFSPLFPFSRFLSFFLPSFFFSLLLSLFSPLRTTNQKYVLLKNNNSSSLQQPSSHICYTYPRDHLPPQKSMQMCKEAQHKCHSRVTVMISGLQCAHSSMCHPKLSPAAH